ncbi:hypothetical protein F0L74_20400 [Chitinophaga agrisoli]|uniref:Urease accessory protein UreH-like transmembrane domain-containing protein n=1 Tax=Chitinophaga agrisoli TaxID=2607653 RepID=A0A5B2VK31_9BACT|nr:sulfite exporter TauE/SafE family protein [Chitinophaga agrisoli]KAA2238587.1 hypothetical protein F0L74_20400 [Chitinophaga agrisoli]
MTSETGALLLTAIAISCVHTVTGPDHYVPFIALSQSRKWSPAKTVLWTIICGIGHVGSSVLLGLLGVFLGWEIGKISWLEGLRGGIAGWALLFFGLAYLVWGLRRAYLNKPHKHFDMYEDGSVYVYEHKHGEGPVYPQERTKVTPWILFIIFALGPCEPLIPLLTYPAARQSTLGIVLLVVTFMVFTLIAMVVMVMLGYYGYAFFKTDRLERYIHAIGGATVTICGAGMVFMGW